jgi:anti-sigma regulatory factor (Ser/Thr protein kinase)
MNSSFDSSAAQDGRVRPVRVFTQQFSSTRRGARLARLLAAHQLDAWGWPHRSETSRTAALLVGELASNAVFHGLVPGRDFRLCLTVGDAPGRAVMSTVLRIAVTDPRGERLPRMPEPTALLSGATNGPDTAPVNDAEAGRGLLLIQALATRWGVRPYPPSGKTVWCELAVSAHT